MSNKQAPSPWQSILAGAAAGGLESLLTYPTEYLKTRQQLQATLTGKPLSPGTLLVQTIRQHGLGHIYTGSAAFCLSNAGKSGVRFFVFDTARQWMPTDKSGKTTAWGNLCAGMIAGTAESVLVVTPGETLKTKIIDDQSGPKRYTSAPHAVRSVISTEGVSGLYRGVVPVTLKQSANAMVRFTSYNFFLGQLEALASDETPMTGSTAIAGAMAGVVTVYATMPFDTIKTRLQALDGHQRYAGTLDCLRLIVSREGVSVLWRGTTPRLARLSISGAVSFTIYEQVIRWTSSFSPVMARDKATNNAGI
ncbi:mitochondrial carrier domain-containing protein [Aspergillus heterothallicus]